jgi:hypothetical protein
MTMLSPVTAAVKYEVWLYARPAFRQPVQCCGLYGSEDEACRVGARVRDWVRLGVFPSDLHDALPDDDLEDLYLLRLSLLRGFGIDLSRVLVTVRKVGGGFGDNAPLGAEGEHYRLDGAHAATDLDDDDDKPDDGTDATTPIVSAEVLWGYGEQ